MTGWNLPPGVNESDIPGNRPEDIAMENFMDDHYCPYGDTEFCDDHCDFGPQPCSHPQHPDNLSKQSKYDTDEKV